MQELHSKNASQLLALAVEEVGKAWETLYELRTLEAQYWREKCEFLELIAREG